MSAGAAGKPQVATTPDRLRELHAGQPVLFVPTMGSLHAGHLALVDRARQLARSHGADAKVCVSIFVNPLQFSPGEDAAGYPRDRGHDLAALAGHADTCYIPDVQAIYPQQQQILVQPPALGSQLCGKSRPGHFAGVLTVVLKLFMQVAPQVAVFGRKDYQQLVLIRQMVEQLQLPVRIVDDATVREADGLAMSSRNLRLTASERQIAPRLHEQLGKAAARIAAGGDIDTACKAAETALTEAGFAVDYIECRSQALAQPAAVDDGFVVLGAARLGRVRLIDNIEHPAALVGS